LDSGFVDFLAGEARSQGIEADRLVIEIVEHAPAWDIEACRPALAALRDHGASIALDDVGLGHSNFMMILECRPDYFKVDRYFVDGCHQDSHRRAVLASVARLARPFHARVVAEGVEDPADLTALARLGITLVQGHVFGLPAPVGVTLWALRPQTRSGAVEVDGVDLARYFTFSVAGEEYGISVLAVREILECGTVRRVPRTPAFIRGVIALRGRAVPVVDLAARFGLARGAAGRPASVVIVEVEVEGQRVVVGLMADAVNGFLTGMGRAGRRRVALRDGERLP